ncbi:type I toxin-antitoxin system Fst family toxin [Lapidilactobacillus gannanensis]|uniref:Type I toxin-antitoxin system Fst family toxin n=1 Tax=Lapidilactobacillus gannanensis TaxID=2486002 RepID=A0ABW4BKV4_9LACO
MEVISMVASFLMSLLVGVLLALFDYWLNNHHRK